jgi:hypothetical protein
VIIEFVLWNILAIQIPELGTGGSYLVVLATQEQDIRRIVVQSQPLANSSQTLSQINLSQKRAGREAPAHPGLLRHYSQ